MNKLDHVVELAKSSHQHLPALLLFLAGFASFRKDSLLNIGEENHGDNIPVTLMESVNREGE